MGAFSEGLRDRLKNLLILLGVDLVGLLSGRDILFQIAHGMFPGLQSFGEQAGGLHINNKRSEFLINDSWTTPTFNLRLTVVGSISGMGSSFMLLIVVPCRSGNG